MISILLAVSSYGQTASPTQASRPTASPTPAAKTRQSFLKDIGHDQKAIWTAPFRIDRDDVKWALPFAIGAAGIIRSDKYTSAWVSENGSLHSVSKWVSYGGNGWAELGLIGGFYVFGHMEHSRRAAETARLSLESLIDTTIVVTALKSVTQRPRPNDHNGRGTFFKGGHSFPSGHAASTWSIASVIANEYGDRAAVKYGAYAAAAAVSLSRYTGRNHFLSDVLVGGALGFYTGRFVYHSHHVSGSQPDNGTDPTPKQTTRLLPLLTPVYNPRSMTYGVRAVWLF